MDLVVVAEAEARRAVAAGLAQRLGLPLVESSAGHDGLVLAYRASGLELREADSAAGAVRVSFESRHGSSLLRRATLAGRREGGRIIDATAGLGRDAFAMAEAGSRVVLIERSPVVSALLADGLERAGKDPALRDTAARMRLHVGEAAELLGRLAPADVVYLDPMYPQSGREGRKNKEMRMLRMLLGSDQDAGSLLGAARLAARRRVAVKRPSSAPPLAQQRPSGTLRGTTVRYDLYGPLAEGG